MKFQHGLATEPLTAMAGQLYSLRQDYPPLTKRDNGKYEGNILGFVKGLRVSALLIYCLRQWLDDTGWKVDWGHIVDNNGRSCSPECDIVIHKGHFRHWNGDGGMKPVMDFKFITSTNVVAVVSCKSQVTMVDDHYPSQLRPFGVEKVFLFGECCSETNYANLADKAREAGYMGLWCAYHPDGESDSFKINEKVYENFYEVIRGLKT